MTAADSDRRRGAALFIVLAVSALLASLVGAAMRTGVSGARAAAVFADAERADQLGRSAADIVAYRLSTGGSDAQRGGRLSLKLGDAEIAIDYLSESARIDANAAPVPLISALLAAAGADPSTVGAVAARIARLRQKNGGRPPQPGQAPATAQAPAAAAPGSAAAAPAAPAPAGPAQSAGPPAVQDPLDIARVWGLPEDVARRVLPALTVASGSNQVDPILAGRLVVTALLSGDETRTDDYLERRSQGFATTDSALALLPVPAQPFAGFTDVPAVRALARVTIARRLERRYEMVIVPAQGPSHGPNVVSWRELF